MSTPGFPVTTLGIFTEYTVPTSGAGPLHISSGPDGALWFRLRLPWGLSPPWGLPARRRIGNIAYDGPASRSGGPGPRSNLYGYAVIAKEMACSSGEVSWHRARLVANRRTNSVLGRVIWQRAYIERALGTIRRECLDHVIIIQ